MRRLLPHEKAAFLLGMMRRAAFVGAALWTLMSLTLDTEGAIVSFADFFVIWAVGAIGHAMGWAFVMWAMTAVWLRRRGGCAFV